MLIIGVEMHNWKNWENKSMFSQEEASGRRHQPKGEQQVATVSVAEITLL